MFEYMVMETYFAYMVLKIKWDENRFGIGVWR